METLAAVEVPTVLEFHRLCHGVQTDGAIWHVTYNFLYLGSQGRDLRLHGLGLSCGSLGLAAVQRRGRVLLSAGGRTWDDALFVVGHAVCRCVKGCVWRVSKGVGAFQLRAKGSRRKLSGACVQPKTASGGHHQGTYPVATQPFEARASKRRGNKTHQSTLLEKNKI